jgi:hypothetical protein
MPMSMDDEDPREEILRLEARIEALSATLEGCRKIMLASQAAIAIGIVLILAIAFGAIVLHPVALLGAMTAVIGGIVLLGSNKSTSEQAAAARQAAEARRAELIGRIRFQVVGGTDIAGLPLGRRTLH